MTTDFLPSRSRQRDVSDFDIFVGPLVEQLDAAYFGDDLLWENWVASLRALNFDLAVVRHVCDGAECRSPQ